MALTIKQLNSNVSFLLTFEPLGGNVREPFRILLDPVLEEPYNEILHSESSLTLNGQQGWVPSLRDLPEPDLVIVTQNRSSHLHEATLRQLAPGGTKTLILAEAPAAKTIRSWKHFDDGIVKVLPPWEEPRQKGRNTTIRLTVSPCYFGGDQGEVTISLIIPKKDVKGVNSAIGITYRPPPSRPSIFRRPVPTPPATPTSVVSATPPQLPPPTTDLANRTFTARIVPPTPPDSPILSQPLDSIRSMASLPQHTYDRTLSVIFSPHGTSYSSLEPYATSHLVSEAALPLTALLHPFNAEPTPWWFVGNAAASPPVGQATALALGARTWLNTTHNEDQQLTTGAKRSRRKIYTLNEVRKMLEQAEGKEKKAFPSRKAPKPTEVLDLGQGEEVTLTSEGIWETQPAEASQKGMVPDALGVFNNFLIG